MNDSSLRTEWFNRMHFMRRCIGLANAINNSTTPQQDDPLKIGNLPKGKVLLLFACNEENIVGETFAPLQSVLITIPVDFPKDKEDRRRMMRLAAERDSVKFDDKALEFVLEKTKDYSGRELLGDGKYNSGLGFLPSAIAAVKRRENALWEANNNYKPDFTITIDIVERLVSSIPSNAAELNRTAKAPLKQSERDAGESAPRDTVPSWVADLDIERMKNFAKKILQTHGEWIEHNPEKVRDGHGDLPLRVVFALIYDALQQQCKNMPTRKITRKDKGESKIVNRDEWLCRFNEIFGFGDGVVGAESFTRPSESASLYCKNLPTDVFPPAPGLRKYGMARIKSDAEELRKAGIQLCQATTISEFSDD